MKTQTESTPQHDDVSARRDTAFAKPESGQKSESGQEKLSAQLGEWGTQLDALIVGYLEAGALQHDPYRLRIDALRARLGTINGLLDTYSDPVREAATPRGTWTAFRASIADDYSALKSGLADVTR